MVQPENKPEDTPVPPLRLELSLTSVGHDITGALGFVLSDPISHRFFRLSSGTINILRHWHRGTMGAVAEAAAVTLDEVKAIVEFLIMSRLVMVAPGNSKSLGDEQARREQSIANRALHGYLFFRVPLFNPEPFLDWAMPFARLLVSRTAIWLVVFIGLVGAYFAFRQWDHFVTTFVDFFSPQGFVLYTATLVGLKVFHELGHGFVARSYGCRVPTIGVAFMVLTPMLYTEASDAWRLPSHMQRFRIAAAGVMVEIALAAAALFLWAFCPMAHGALPPILLRQRHGSSASPSTCHPSCALTAITCWLIYWACTT